MLTCSFQDSTRSKFLVSGGRGGQPDRKPSSIFFFGLVNVEYMCIYIYMNICMSVLCTCVWPVGNVSSHVIWKTRHLLKIKTKEISYIGQWCLSPLRSRHLDTSVLPVAISYPVVFSWIMLWNLFPFKGDFSFGKSQESQSAKSRL